jgi:hypothetical protein
MRPHEECRSLGGFGRGSDAALAMGKTRGTQLGLEKFAQSGKFNHFPLQISRILSILAGLNSRKAGCHE